MQLDEFDITIEVGNDSYLGQGSGRNRPDQFQYYTTARKWHAHNAVNYILVSMHTHLYLA